MIAESLNDALIEAVKALGGSKKAGEALWPAKGVEAAQRHLLACLNPERQEKLSPDEAHYIERLARAIGCHVVAEFRNHSLSYAAPVPLEPKDEADELRRQYIEAARSMASMATRIEQLEKRQGRAGQ